MSNSDLLGSKEAAEVLGISRTSLNRAVRAGDIPPVAQIPGKTGAYLFDARVIDALAKNPADAHTDSESGAVA